MQRDYVVAYHGTCEAFYAHEKTEGILPGHKGGGDQWAFERHKTVAIKSALRREPSVYVATEKAAAEQFALLCAEENRDKPALLKLHIPREAFKSQFVEDELSERKARNFIDAVIGRGKVVAFRTEKPIPAAWIVAEEAQPENAKMTLTVE